VSYNGEFPILEIIKEMAESFRITLDMEMILKTATSGKNMLQGDEKIFSHRDAKKNLAKAIQRMKQLDESLKQLTQTIRDATPPPETADNIISELFCGR
jgi:hypothetical protein